MWWGIMAAMVIVWTLLWLIASGLTLGWLVVTGGRHNTGKSHSYLHSLLLGAQRAASVIWMVGSIWWRLMKDSILLLWLEDVFHYEVEQMRGSQLVWNANGDCGCE